MMNMSLSSAVILFGGFVLLAGILPVLIPAQWGKWMKNFPRNREWGWALVAVGIGWSAYLIFRSAFVNAFLDRFQYARTLAYVAVPISYFLIICLMDELLAARALGGLFLLAPAPILAAARCHESSLRMIVVVLAYMLVIAGMALVLSPYHFRQATERLYGNKRNCRVTGLVFSIAGVLLVVLGATLFRISPVMQ
ncbi:MAG: DUF2065 family protein [Lentisphaerae bacterium]|nr:DUF2065 family protein [Lentisphaerota bacterium]